MKAPLFNTGEVISERDKCPQCKGNKVTQEKKVLEVHVEKGMQHGQKITFEGQADEAVSEITFGIDFRVLAIFYSPVLAIDYKGAAFMALAGVFLVKQQ